MMSREMPRGKATAIFPDPDNPGQHLATGQIDNLGPVCIEISEQLAIQAAVTFQKAFLERAEKMEETPNYLQPKVERFYIGHGPNGQTALMVSTAQLATLALVMTPTLLTQLESMTAQIRQKMTSRQQ